MGALWTPNTFHNPMLLLQKLGSLWEHGFHNWAQILGRTQDGRTYFLEERELIWVNPSFGFPLPNTLIHALKYLRAVLASTSLAHLQNLRKKDTFTNVGGRPHRL
jgi:hypothetical protein